MRLLKFALTKALNTFFPIIFMSKRSNANKAAIKVLAIFLAIFGLTALSIAGLLSYYASAVATVTVSQGVVVELGLNNNSIITLSHNPGSSPNVTLTATGAGGGKTDTFNYNGNTVSYVKIRHLGNVVEAPLTIELTLGDNFIGLFREIVEYGLSVTRDGTNYHNIKINSTHVCVGSFCNDWSSNQVTFNNQFTVTRNDTTKKLTITGFTLATNSELTINNLYVVWNPATEPKTYTLTVTVLPA
ncbi:MAG: hypothetical protein KQA34_03020 [Candidatus Aenigmarchaeota archaeon]|nr:hypothetical protein [Candidatus Aenigmarchaeota archaeon]